MKALKLLWAGVRLCCPFCAGTRWFRFPCNTRTPARKYPGARLDMRQHEKTRKSRIKLDGFLRVA